MVRLRIALSGAGATQSESEAVPQHSLASSKPTGRREPPSELDWSRAEYVPLPPSPPTWEVDGRDEFHREYTDPILSPIFRAAFKGQHTKVVKFASELSPHQRRGKIGAVVAQAYRKLIVQRMKAGQLAAAAKQCLEMFDQLPGEVEERDKRSFNRILTDMGNAGKDHRFARIEASKPSAQPLFTVSEGSGWILEDERKLRDMEQPDLAFDVIACGLAGTWLLARSGGGARRPEGTALLKRLDRFGNLVAERALSHDVYRTGGAATGSTLAIMDSGGVLHIYDAALKPVLETNLRDDHRVVEHFRTIETNYWGEFKSQVRAVDVAPEGERYLFTLADEAWCCTLQGRVAWGIMMPLKEGWQRVVARSERFGAGRDVDEALRLFGLSLPVAPADIKRRYRALALANHPDRHPADRHAAEGKMKALNLAFEVLTGVDPNTLELEKSGITTFARTGPDASFEVAGVRVEMTMTGGSPQDWIYQASFAARNGGAYLASYSGKVVLLSREGQARTVYDLGTCPDEIVDTGHYTYFLTPTRLYVIEAGNKLAAFLDVFQQGRLVVAHSGFGLLTSKRLQWFTTGGAKMGELGSRDPIRAVHATEDGAIVKTRKHQVRVRGLEL